MLFYLLIALIVLSSFKVFKNNKKSNCNTCDNKK